VRAREGVPDGETERAMESEGLREGKRGRERYREAKGIEGKWGEKRAAHGPSLRVTPREIS
jgi:hypothetical protein